METCTERVGLRIVIDSCQRPLWVVSKCMLKTTKSAGFVCNALHRVHESRAATCISIAVCRSLPSAADFLSSCYLCKRELGSDQDIYMYRGDRGFCSEKCRSQQIMKDERKQKYPACPNSSCGRSPLRPDTSAI